MNCKTILAPQHDKRFAASTGPGPEICGADIPLVKRNSHRILSKLGKRRPRVQSLLLGVDILLVRRCASSTLIQVSGRRRAMVHAKITYHAMTEGGRNTLSIPLAKFSHDIHLGKRWHVLCLLGSRAAVMIMGGGA